MDYRYATEGIVQDGFAELLEHAESVISEPIKQWIAFSDSTVSNGKMYMHAGFEFDKQLPPDYTYVVKKERKPKTSYRKSRFVNDPKLVWQDGKSEKELAIMNGLYRIWDAGTVRWMKRLSPSEDDSKKTTTKDMTKDTR